LKLAFKGLPSNAVAPLDSSSLSESASKAQSSPQAGSVVTTGPEQWAREIQGGSPELGPSKTSSFTVRDTGCPEQKFVSVNEALEVVYIQSTLQEANLLDSKKRNFDDAFSHSSASSVWFTRCVRLLGQSDLCTQEADPRVYVAHASYVGAGVVLCDLLLTLRVHVDVLCVT
jgi:hypothetical protein